jgi:hypothetical protein
MCKDGTGGDARIEAMVDITRTLVAEVKSIQRRIRDYSVLTRYIAYTFSGSLVPVIGAAWYIISLQIEYKAVNSRFSINDDISKANQLLRSQIDAELDRLAPLLKDGGCSCDCGTLGRRKRNRCHER